MDSSGWLALLQKAPGHQEFGRRLAEADDVLVPTIVLTEVFKVVYRLNGRADAMKATAWLRQYNSVPLDEIIAVHAGRLAIDAKLSIADSIIYATASMHEATLVTGDSHFEGLPLVDYVRWVGDTGLVGPEAPAAPAAAESEMSDDQADAGA